MEAFKRILQFVVDVEIVVAIGFIVYFVTKPLVRWLCDWRIASVRAKTDRRIAEFEGRYSETFPTVDAPDLPREQLPPIPPALLAGPDDHYDTMIIMNRMPHFRKIGDEWHVRGPLEALGGQTSVTVRRKDQSEVTVWVDPDTLTPVPREERTQWDGRKPHTVKVINPPPEMCEICNVHGGHRKFCPMYVEKRRHDDSPDWTL